MWAAGPVSDLWSAIAAEVVTRPPGFITVTKVKSHLDPSEASGTYEQRLIAGNAKADFWAKQAQI